MLLQVCLQKEQESRVSMELQVTRMEEHLDQVTSELSLAREERGRLEKQLEEAQSRNWVHNWQWGCGIAKLNYRRRIAR